jgi:DNA-binding response OmpR family regulator
LSRQEIYEKVWGEFDWDFMFSKTIDVYIWYLRKKLGKEIIETKKAYWFMIK